MRAIFGAAAILAMTGAAAHAQAPWPTRDVRWMIPWGAGGPSDFVGRVIAMRLSERSGKAVIVENRPGASGEVGLRTALQRPADGYTVISSIPAIYTNPFFFKNSTDPAEVTPVTQIAGGYFILVARPDLPQSSVSEIVSFAKASPKRISCGGAGSLATLGCFMLSARAGGNILFVPYSNSALAPVMGKQVDIAFEFVNTAGPQVRAGSVRGLAVTSAERANPPFADLPTMSETLPGFELNGWHAVFVAAATPRQIVSDINHAVNAVLNEPETRARLEAASLDVVGGPEQAFAEKVKGDFAVFKEAAKAAGVQPE